MLAQFAIDAVKINLLLIKKLANIFLDLSKFDVLLRFAMSGQHVDTTFSTFVIISEALKLDIDLNWWFVLDQKFFLPSCQQTNKELLPFHGCFHVCKRSFVDDISNLKHLRCCDGIANPTNMLAYY